MTSMTTTAKMTPIIKVKYGAKSVISAEVFAKISVVKLEGRVMIVSIFV